MVHLISTQTILTHQSFTTSFNHLSINVYQFINSPQNISIPPSIIYTQLEYLSSVDHNLNFHNKNQCNKPKRKQDDSWFKDKVLLVQAPRNVVNLHEETRFLAVLRNSRRDLSEVYNHDNCENDLTNQVYAGLLPSSEQSNVVNHLETEITSDSNIISYSQYLIKSQQVAVQNSNSSAQQDDLILSVIEQLKSQVVNCTKINLENKSVNDTLTAELERYKEQVKVLKEGQNVDLRSNDNVSDSSAQSVEIDRLKQTLSEHLKEKESLMQTVSLLKDDFKKEESRNIDREIALEKRIKQLDNIVFKRDQSAQTVHMLTKPQFFYDHTTKQALVIPDSEETLLLAKESRSKILLKQKDHIMLEKKWAPNSGHIKARSWETIVVCPRVISARALSQGLELCSSFRFQVLYRSPFHHVNATTSNSTTQQNLTLSSVWYPKGIGIEIVVYADSDHAGDYVDRKSTSGICTLVGCCLTSWFSKKQTVLAISTTEAGYVSAGKACQQALWMKQALIDYDVRLDGVPIMCDNKGAINLSKNLVHYSRTKHIEIRHHFLCDNVQKGHISIEKVPPVTNTADILTKPLKRESFNYLREMTLEDELRYTKSYVPTILNENYIPDILKPIIRNLECRSIHEGRPISPESTKYDNIQTLFQVIKLLKIYELHEGICPRFLLEFYSSIEIIKDENLNIFLTFWALKRTFKFSLESFASILSIPCEGECSYSKEPSLDSLKTNQESNTPYQTHIPTPKEIIQSITTTGQTIFPNIILKEELRHDMRSWNEIIQDNAFGTQNDSPFLPASSCHMMYCILTSTPFNFAYFLTKRVENIKNQPNSPMPYGMILNRLYDHIIKINPHL
ncbi:hypothetical protein Tco_0024332 [Tanacetum coccineum]